MNTNYKSKLNGFTIVELAVVIAVIGILSTLGMMGWRNWQQSIATSAVKSDLKQAAAAMDTARNFGNSGYPGSLPLSYKAGPNVTVLYVSGDSTEFCIQGTSTKTSSVIFHINSSVSKEPATGGCAGGSISVPTVASVNVSSSSATLSWNAVSGATTYDVQKKLSSASMWDATVSKTTTSHTYSGLQLGVTYDFRIRAAGASGDSGWSSIVSRVTVPTPTGVSVTDLVCGNSGGMWSWKDGTLSWTAAPNAVATLYRITSTQGQPGVTKDVANSMSQGGAMTTTASSTQWGANEVGYGTFTVQGIGPNGEVSAPASVSTPEYQPYEC